MSTKKRLHTPKISLLTKTEKEILIDVTEKYLSEREIMIKRNCTRQAVNKHMNNLKRKGALNSGLQSTEKKLCSCQPNKKNVNRIRLHGQEFKIKLIKQNPRYQELLKKSNKMYIDGHTIKLYKNSIEIYAGKGASFYGKDAWEADREASEYWHKFFTRLEHELSSIVIKERSRNIKEVNHHYARGDSEMCEDALREDGKHIRVFCPIDGKLAFITDCSFGDNEDEAVHPTTAKQDRENISKQINDWRINDPPTLSEIMHLIREQINIGKETAAGLLALTNLLMPQKTNVRPQDSKLNIPSYLG